ncbi:MAG: hypothetical protein U0S12_08950 [Fimbriimonadales bacterium]
MSGSLKLGLILIAAVLFGGLLLRVVTGLVAGIWGMITPIALVAGVCLVVFGLINRKALGGGRRYLP